MQCAVVGATSRRMQIGSRVNLFSFVSFLSFPSFSTHSLCTLYTTVYIPGYSFSNFCSCVCVCVFWSWNRTEPWFDDSGRILVSYRKRLKTRRFQKHRLPCPSLSLLLLSSYSFSLLPLLSLVSFSRSSLLSLTLVVHSSICGVGTGD